MFQVDEMRVATTDYLCGSCKAEKPEVVTFNAAEGRIYICKACLQNGLKLLENQNNGN